MNSDCQGKVKKVTLQIVMIHTERPRETHLTSDCSRETCQENDADFLAKDNRSPGLRKTCTGRNSRHCTRVTPCAFVVRRRAPPIRVQ
jgi:hypothetical protein